MSYQFKSQDSAISVSSEVDGMVELQNMAFEFQILDWDISHEKPIFKALANKDITFIKKYLKEKGDVHLCLTYGISLLGYLGKLGNLEFLKWFVEACPRGLSDFSRAEQSQVLFSAIEKGHTHLVEYLIKAKISCRTASKKSLTTPLMLAAEKGYHRIVKLLIPHSEVDAYNVNGWTALMFAAFNNKGRQFATGSFEDIQAPEISPHPIEGKADVEHRTIATETNCVEVVRLLIVAGADVKRLDTASRSALYFAAKNADAEMVAILLKNKNVQSIINKVDNDGASPLHMATMFGQCEKAIKMLLEAGADVNQLLGDYGQTPLIIAMKPQGKLGIVEVLVQHKASLDVVESLQNSALIVAASLNWTAAVRLLVENKARLDLVNSCHLTALSIAAKSDRMLDIVNYLIDKAHEDVNKQYGGKEAVPPLITAAEQGAVLVVKKLIHAKADLNAVDHYGLTALMWAARMGHLEIVKILSENVDPASLSDIHRSERGSVLGWAIIGGNVEVIQFLIDKNADINAVCFNHNNIWVPLNIAINMRNFDVVKLLINANANIACQDADIIPPLRLVSTENPEILRFLLDALLKSTQDNSVKEQLILSCMMAHVKDDCLEFVGILLHSLNAVLELNQNDATQYNDIILQLFKNAVGTQSQKVLEFLMSDKRIYDTLIQHRQDMFIHGAYEGALSLMKFLVERLQVDVNCVHLQMPSMNALRIAAMSNHLEVVKYLLDKGVNFEIMGVDNQTAMSAASSLKFHDIAVHLYHRKIWIGLRDNFVKENLADVKAIKELIEQFCCKLLTMAHQLDASGILKFQVDKEHICELTFEGVLESVKKIYLDNKQKKKKSFDFDKLGSFLVEMCFKLNERLKEAKKAYETAFVLEKTSIVSQIELEKANSLFPFELQYGINMDEFFSEMLGMVPEDANIEKEKKTFHEVVHENYVDKNCLIEKLKNMIEASNRRLNLHLDVASVTTDTLTHAVGKFSPKISELITKNSQKQEKLADLSRELLLYLDKFQDLREKFLLRWIELNSKVEQLVVDRELTAAKRQLKLRDADSELVGMLKSREACCKAMLEIRQEFMSVLDELTQQSDWEISVLQNGVPDDAFSSANKPDSTLIAHLSPGTKNLEPSPPNATEFNVGQDEKLEIERSELLAKEQKAKQYRQEAFAKLKERRRAFWQLKLQEIQRKRAVEHEAKLAFERLQTEKYNMDTHSELWQRRQTLVNKYCPMVFRKQGNVDLLVSLVDELVVLEKILAELNALATVGLEGQVTVKSETTAVSAFTNESFVRFNDDNNATLSQASNVNDVYEKNACLGIFARLMETIAQRGGIPFISEKEAQHLRNVLYHAPKSSFQTITHSELVNMMKSLCLYLHAQFKQSKEVGKLSEALKSNKIYKDILGIKLGLCYPSEHYMIEINQDRNDEILYRQCKNVSPFLMEQACRYTIGRIGASCRSIKTHYPKEYRENAVFLQKNTNPLNAAEMEGGYIVWGIKMRHLKTNPYKHVAMDWLNIEKYVKQENPSNEHDLNHNSADTKRQRDSDKGNSTNSERNDFLPSYQKAKAGKKAGSGGLATAGANQISHTTVANKAQSVSTVIQASQKTNQKLGKKARKTTRS